MATERDLVVLGAGMHPWGKWGKNFVDYGLVAAKAALADADVAWRDIEFVAGADTIRNGYPGFVAGSTFSQAMGWTGAQISSSYAACASGAQAMQSARAQILAGFADVAMVIGADTTPKGFFAPVGGERKEDPDWQRFHLLGATNPAFFALNARRRIDVFGDTVEDFALVKVKNSKAGVGNPNARFRKEFTLDDFAGSPIVSPTPRRPTRRFVLNFPTSRPTPTQLCKHRRLVSKIRLRITRTNKPDLVRKMFRVQRSTTFPPRSNSTGTRTSASAPKVKVRDLCVTASPHLAVRSRSTHRAVSPHSAKPFPHKPLLRCVNLRGSCKDAAMAIRSKTPR